MKMEETWRWYGPNDPVTLADVKQSGATGVVSALHDLPTGELWTVEAIMERKKLIEASGLEWSVVESVAVHEAIKQGLPSRDEYLATYAQCLRNLGACGIHRVCYNFMPVIDWTRTELEREWPDGSHALAFDFDDFIAFDLHILRRPGAYQQYDAETRARADARFASMSAERQKELAHTVTAGLPGGFKVEVDSLAQFQSALDAYAHVDAGALRENLAYFLRAVVPAAEEAGVFLGQPREVALALAEGLARHAEVLAARDDGHARARREGREPVDEAAEVEGGHVHDRHVADRRAVEVEVAVLALVRAVPALDRAPAQPRRRVDVAARGREPARGDHPRQRARRAWRLVPQVRRHRPEPPVARDERHEEEHERDVRCAVHHVRRAARGRPHDGGRQRVVAVLHRTRARALPVRPPQAETQGRRAGRRRADGDARRRECATRARVRKNGSRVAAI